MEHINYKTTEKEPGGQLGQISEPGRTGAELGRWANLFFLRVHRKVEWNPEQGGTPEIYKHKLQSKEACLKSTKQRHGWPT